MNSFGMEADGGAGRLTRSGRDVGKGPRGAQTVAAWQRAAGTVTREDLEALGIQVPRSGTGVFGNLPSDAVDPEEMKFNAIMNLKRAQQQGFGVEQAQKGVDQAEMAALGKDEALRRRQKGFNDRAADVQTGKVEDLRGNPYDGYTSELIGAQTGAALASHARAGKIAALPEANRPMTAAQHMADHPSYAQFGTPGAMLGRGPEPEAPYVLGQAAEQPAAAQPTQGAAPAPAPAMRTPMDPYKTDLYKGTNWGAIRSGFNKARTGY